VSQPRAAILLALVVTALAFVSLPLASQNPPMPGPDHSLALSSYLGLQVQSIDFRSDPGVNNNSEKDEQELLKALSVKIGDTLTRQKLRNSIQALQSTGRFAAIEVEAIRVDQNKLALTFVTKPNFFIGLIRVEGAPQPPTPNQLANATKLELGQLFSLPGLDRGIAQMKRVMEDNGYFKSEIKADYALDANTQQATITFAVQPGDRAMVGKVTVTGDPGISAEEVMNVAKLNLPLLLRPPPRTAQSCAHQASPTRAGIDPVHPAL